MVDPDVRRNASPTNDALRSAPRYDRSRSYKWNYHHAPEPFDCEVAEVPGEWRFCGLPVASPLGVPAGPLLNGRWCLYYASLGFDVVTYKTVRSRERACYELPNLQPVACGALQGNETDVPAIDEMRGSWAVAFGMPSQPPDVWRRDVAATRDALEKRKILSVSVVGTMQDGWSIEELGADYAQCAQWAVQSGADAVEINFSCPNVATCDGQLYQDSQDAATVAAMVRAAIDSTPLVVKIGHVTDHTAAAQLVESLAPHATALAMTNSVATTVVDHGGRRLFGGERRGICGAATLDASLVQTEIFAAIIAEQRCALQLIGVGGVRSAADVQAYLARGAHATHIATQAMVDPSVALRIRADLAADARANDADDSR